MNTGVGIIKLHIPESQSLKDKRQVVKSVVARLKNRFNISIAEVDDNDLWQVAMLGISCVSNNDKVVDETFTKIINFIENNYPELEIVNQEIEILHGP
jgi:uncharacterized protein YlxP (DUF503 family)